MTQKLKDLVAQLSTYSEQEQEEWASRWFEELADDAKWDASFAATTDEQFEKMVKSVKADIAAGRVIDKGIDEL